MKRFAVDVSTRQFFKKGEDICGDAVKVVNTPDSTIIVISDGLGSGVKANVLSTLTVELTGGLFQGDLSLREIVETLIATLPVCKWRNIAYSTFTIVRIYDTGQVTIAEYDSPNFIKLEDGIKPEPIPSVELEICDKTIRESFFRMQPGDSLVMYSDGIVYAGVGSGLPMGWQEEGILEYVTTIAPSVNGDCSLLVNKIADQAIKHWKDSPGDDGTVLCAKYRNARLATVLTGPPQERSMVHKMIREFLSHKGVKIVCGGTSSHLVAERLQQQLEMDERYLDSDLPPTAKLQGVDLVTEGILTLSRAAEYLKRGIPQGKKNAATLLLEHLLYADGVTFMVGTARNPAHQNTGLPESIFLRRTVVEDLATQLRGMGKEVELIYY
ncbi:MAG: SpoIIE family protein phosphatase [Armatimonadota bacterium]